MFSTSTQKKNWIFAEEETLRTFRYNTNRDFIEKYGKPGMTDESRIANFLTHEEEKILLHYYELILRDFCFKFQPPMGKSVFGTAMHYFKRFYLFNSPMDYHPKDIYLTCAYLASKVDEFNVSIVQFVANLPGDRERMSENIVNLELLIMSAMSYNLTIHNPFRPVEGILIDIKTRHGKFDPEVLRPYIDDFLDKVLLTDAPFLYAPSQIALAAVLQAASKCKENLDAYITETLFPDKTMLEPVVAAVRSIRSLVRQKNYNPPPKDVLRNIEVKLERCRNQENNPNNELFKKKFEDDLDEEDQSFMGLK